MKQTKPGQQKQKRWRQPEWQNRKEESTRVLEGSVEKEVYLTIKVTIDITSVLCAEKGWKGAEL